MQAPSYKPINSSLGPSQIIGYLDKLKTKSTEYYYNQINVELHHENPILHKCDLEMWIHNNCLGKWNSDFKHNYRWQNVLTFYFELKQDAAIFKLLVG